MRTPPRRSGWSLIEILVVMVLASILLVVISSTLSSTLRSAALETRRSAAQTQLETILGQLERLVRSSSVAGTSYLDVPGSPTVLAIHCVSSQQLTSGAPNWNPYWSCIVWKKDVQKLYLRDCPPGPPALASPKVDRPHPMDPQSLGQVGTELGGSLLSDHCTAFSYSTEEGALAHVQIEVQIPNDSPSAKPELLNASRKFLYRVKQ